MNYKKTENIDTKVLVTGCAGFIGSNLVDSLLNKGYSVVGIDNLVTGNKKFLEKASNNKNFTFVELDLLIDTKKINSITKCHTVFHFAANADVRFGIKQPRKDLEQNTIVTHNVLEMMRRLEIQNIVFASTGSIYGEAKTIPTTESSEFPIQTSLYGASKLACEGMIQAYCEGFGIKSWIFRFVSILGTRYTHGHIYDFMKQLKIDSNNLKVLGNGHQRKSYLHISDCVNGVLIGIEKSSDKINIFNLGIDETCEVNDSINWICRELSLNPKIIYESELRGWVGDNPLIHLDTSRIQRLGWKPKFSIENSIKDTVKYLKENDWLFN